MSHTIFNGSVQSHIVTQEFDGPKMTLNSIFDSIHISKHFPFATTTLYTKILRNYIPPGSWTNEVNKDSILLKHSPSPDIVVDIHIRVLNKGFCMKFNIADIQERYKTLYTQIFDDELLSYISPVDESTSEYLCDFYIMNKKMNKFLLLDTFMNHPMFIIDDSNSSIKTSSNIRVKYNSPDHKSEHVKFTFNPSYIHEQNKELFEPSYLNGTEFVEFSIKSNKSLDMFEDFQKRIDSIITSFQDYEETLRQEYIMYIPDFTKTDIKKELGTKNVKNNAPVNKTTCQGERQPRQSSDLSEVKSHHETPLEYPVGSGTYYYCPGEHTKPGKDNKYIYVGITKSGSPCCFTRKQKKKSKPTVDRTIYGKRSIIPKITGDFLGITNAKEYKMMETDTGPNSFLQSVILSVTGNFSFDHNTQDLDVKSLGLAKTLDNRRLKLKKIREKLSKYSYLAKQQLWTFSISDITSMINDPNLIFDPKIFLNVLQEIFQVNIFVISKENDLVVPHYAHSHYKFEYDKHVIILEKSDTEYSPVYHETKVDKKTRREYIFTNDDTVIQNIKHKMSKMTSTIRYNTPYSHTTFPLKYKNIVKNHHYDDFGNVCKLDLDINGKIIRVSTTPIPPFLYNKSEESSDLILTEVDDEDIDEIVECLSFPWIKFQFNNLVVLGDELLGNVNIFIYTKDTDYPQSKLTMFSRNKKLAHTMVEYTCWFFSKYISDRDEDILTSIESFLDQQIQYIPEFKYDKGLIPRNLSQEDNIFVVDEKIIINDIEMKDRLKYSLLHRLKTNKPQLLEYKQYVHPLGYYNSIMDFRQGDSYIMVSSTNTQQNHLINIPKKIHNDVNISLSSEPYFFQFNESVGLDMNTYIAQNTTDKNKAIQTMNRWIKKSVSDDHTIDNVNTYQYIDKHTIKDVNIRNINIKSKLLIVNVGMTKMYVSLLYVH